LSWRVPTGKMSAAVAWVGRGQLTLQVWGAGEDGAIGLEDVLGLEGWLDVGTAGVGNEVVVGNARVQGSVVGTMCKKRRRGGGRFGVNLSLNS
jgi:hypothetical protein